MARNLDVLPEAAAEAVEAVRWYYDRNPRAAIAFRDELARAFFEIAESPAAGGKC